MTLYEEDTKKMFDMISLNNECRRIAEEYICKYYGKMYTFDEAMILAKYLILEKKYEKDSIINGYADNFIINRGKLIIMRSKSIRHENEKIIEIKLKTKKQLIKKETLKKWLITLTTMAIIGSTFTWRFSDKNEKLRDNSSIKLGQLASEVGSEDYNNKLSILEQNLSPQYDENGNYISLNEKLANDIINVCIKDPNLFDVTIYNVYYSLTNNRIDTFGGSEGIWNLIKNYMANDPAFSPLYAKISNQSFLGYILNLLSIRGDIVHFMPEYQNCLNSIEEYNKVLEYEKLSKEAKKVLQNMMDKYQAIGNNLYKSSKGTINDLIDEQQKEAQVGGR